MDDDRNLSDALADAILKMDYPDLHRGDGVYRAPNAPRKRVHRRMPQPPDLILPTGLTWLEQSGRISARISVDNSVVHIGYCAYDANAIAALIEKRAWAKRLALAGADADTIRRVLKEAA